MTRDFCDFVLTLSYDEIPEDVLGIMQRSILDTIGVAAIGSQTEISQIVTRFAGNHMPCGLHTAKARNIFGGQTTSPMGAAMMGAFTIDSIDAHDGFSPAKGHAGSAVFPGVLAVIDSMVQAGKTISGRELLVALTIGYEVSYRCGLTMHATCPDYHTSGAWTAIGVAAAAARLLGLNADQLRHAVGIAEYHGPRSQMMRCIDHPTMLRDGVGWGAPAGVSAAFLALDGFTGAPAITIDSDEAAPFWDDLGARWDILGTHYKAYPVCRWAHPSLDAVHDLMIEHELVSTDIKSARILTFHNATRLAGHEPETLDELTYALAFPMAIMAVRGRIGVDEMTADTLRDPEILRISRATTIEESEEYNRLSTRTRWADVTLTLMDGRVVQSKPYTPRGEPDDPLSDAEISAKFHMFADDVIGRGRADKIEELVALVQQDDFDLGALFGLIYPAP